MPYTENKEVIAYQEQVADNALDAIDSAARKLIDTLDTITRTPGLELLSNVKWQRAIAEIEETCGDLFNSERTRLMQIAGDRPEPKTMVITYHVPRALTNPATYMQLREEL